MFFTKKMKLADLIMHDYHLLPVIFRFGINLGFGDKTVEQICEEKNINSDFFIAIANTFCFEEYFPEEELQRFDIEEIINFLRSSHDFFVNYRLKEMETMLEKIYLNCCKEHNNQFLILKNFFDGFKKELLEHIEFEDKKLFPLILKIKYLQQSENKNELEENLLDDYFWQHTDVEEKLNDLKNIFIKYVPQTIDKILGFEFTEFLFDFEKDLSKHQIIEERVLIAKVRNLIKSDSV